MASSPKNAAAGAARRRRRAILGVAVVLGLSAGTAEATHLGVDTDGHTTLDQILSATNPNASYKTLRVEDVNDNYVTRDPAGVAQAGRAQRRRSLAYFSQLTDFQLADEESPARVEFADQVAGQEGANSAWRPFEALIPFMIDDSIRQINRFALHSPVPQGDGTGNPMDFSLITGDQADNQQRNEVIWTRALLEGGVTLNFNSGLTDPNAYSPTNLPDPVCQSFVAQEGGQSQAAAEGARYTGVQDYTDYPAGAPPGPDPIFYDPNQPTGDWAAWPQYTGLMDRAEKLSITPAGLDIPSYWVNGNHDVLVQGNEDANEEFENIALGCFKALGTTAVPGSFPGPDALDPNVLLFPTAVGMLVPPDPLRRFVSKQQIKAIIGANDVDNDHGFGFVNPLQDQASNGSASYYAWNPPQTPGVRFIAIDTNSEGGILGPFGPQPTGSSDGNLDDPQFKWLQGQLDAAQAAGKLIVVFGHHPVRTLDSTVPDEATGPCTGQQRNFGDNPEHDRNPGCDPDPRNSQPLHLGDPEQAQELGSSAKTFTELLADYPNVIAYVAGHTHEHQLLPCGTPRDPGNKSDTNLQNTRFCKNSQGSTSHLWWEINTSAVADWPHQHRLIEVMDNRDGTLSIFGTVLDHASPATAPAPGNASGFIAGQLASIGRTFGFNDPQKGPPSGEGDPQLDRNDELLLRDPRKADLKMTKSDSPDPVKIGGYLTYTLQADNLGPSNAAGLRVTDQLPQHVHFVTASITAGSGSCSVSGLTVTCALGDIASGRRATVTIKVKMQGTPRTVQNSATVSAVTADPQTANNIDTETTQAIPSG
jgi:uncharacterized repeat protein (TIGR01451 family)